MNLTPEDATAELATHVARDATATPVLLDQREGLPSGDERLDAFQVVLEFAAMVPALTKARAPLFAINSNAPPLQSRSPSPKATLAARAETATISSRSLRAPQWSAPPPSTSSA